MQNYTSDEPPCTFEYKSLMDVQTIVSRPAGFQFKQGTVAMETVKHALQVTCARSRLPMRSGTLEKNDEGNVR